MNKTLLRSLFKSCIGTVFVFFCSTVFAGSNPPTSANDINPILIGEKIPKVSLKTTEGKAFNLAKALKEKPTLMVFYRGGWCPYCNTHLADLRKIEKDLLGLGFQILAISPDLPDKLRDTGEKNKLNYTLLSDSKMELASALGIAFELDAPTRLKYRAYGINLEKSSGEKHNLLPVPSAILTNTDAKVTFTFISPDYRIRADNQVILAAAKAQTRQKK